MTSMNPFVSLAKFVPQPVKQALDPAAYEAQIAGTGMTDIMHTGLAALGAGAAARGGVGLLNLIKRHVNPVKPKYPQAVVTRIPVPVADDVTDEKSAEYTAKTSFPWYYPGMMLAGGLGLYGGWKGVDALFDKQRQAQKSQEMDEAKGDFESALLDSYAKPRRLGAGNVAKTAADELGVALDALFDGMNKEAFNWSDIGGTAAGLYGAYALATGVPAGMWAYDRASKGSRGATLDKAMKLRSRRAYLNRPSEIYAVPDPVMVGRGREQAAQPAAEELDVPQEIEEQKPRRRIDAL